MSIQPHPSDYGELYGEVYAAVAEEAAAYLDEIEAERRDDMEAAFLAGFTTARKRGRHYEDLNEIQRRTAVAKFENWLAGYDR